MAAAGRFCGLYDLKPAKVGQLDRVRTLASDYGKQTEVWQGVDMNVDARLPNGILLQGGVSTGRTVTDNCDVVTKLDNPSELYCHVALPYLPNIKLLGSYMIPAQIQVAATFQSIPGNPISALYVARNADIRPSLGRDLSSGPNGTVPVNVVAPGDPALRPGEPAGSAGGAIVQARQGEPQGDGGPVQRPQFEPGDRAEQHLRHDGGHVAAAAPDSRQPCGPLQRAGAFLDIF